MSKKDIRLLDLTYDEAAVLSNAVLDKIQRSKNSLDSVRTLIGVYDKLTHFMTTSFKFDKDGYKPNRDIDIPF